MKSLIFGDIHNQIEIVEKVLYKLESKYEKIIFLGDYFDSYYDNLKMTENTAYWLKSKLYNDKYKMLFGNHCFHYRFPKNNFVKGSGFSKNKADIINKIIDKNDWNKLLFYYVDQGYIFSHAGFSRNLLHPIKGFDVNFINQKISQDLHQTINGDPSIMFGIGKARNGFNEKGGILWQDWVYEFEPIKEYPQIVGHTHFDNITYKKNSKDINIDAFPNYILEVIDGIPNEIKIEEIL